MSFMTGIIGGALGGMSTIRQSRQDANALVGEGRVSQNQALQDEYGIRRQGRAALGDLAAGMAETGGGQDAGILRQSSINSELDALNTRYGGFMKAYGLQTTARNIKRNAPLQAASQLLSGAASSYTSYKLTH